MILSSVNAVDITINSTENFRLLIEGAKENSIIELNSSLGEFSLNEENVNVTIDKTVTIQSSNSLQKVTINLNQLGRAFTITGEGYLTLINVIIINGTSIMGGAIYNEGGIANLTACTFINNNANNGGVIYNAGGTLIVNDCNFIENEANSGGVIYNDWGNVDLINCTFTENIATVEGGVISNMGGFFTLMDSNFTKNIANGNGGVIYNEGVVSGGFDGMTFRGSITLTNCNLIENEANNGGVVYNGGGASLTAYICNFIRNTANFGGTVYNMGGASLIINASDFTENEASYGGAVYNMGGVSNLTACNFIKNIADSGAAFYIGWGNCNISYSRFIDNIGDYQIYNEEGSVFVDYNWWGSNNPQDKYNSNITLDNYFIMSISINTSNLTLSIGENLVVDYIFVLNGTDDNNDAASKFNPFTVDIVVNDKLYQNIDSRKSAQYNILLAAIDNIITVQLNNETSTVKYKASNKTNNTNNTNNINNNNNTISKISTSLLINSFKPLYNKLNTIKVTVCDKNGKLLVKKQVTLLINGKPVAIKKTNKKGIATFKYKFTTRKSHNITFKLIEDDTHLASNSKILSLIPKDKTFTRLANFSAKSKKKAILKASLKNHNKKAMTKKYIKFYANKRYLGQAKTNSYGVAILIKKIPIKGNVNFIAKYTGGKIYHSSSYTRKIKVK